VNAYACVAKNSSRAFADVCRSSTPLRARLQLAARRGGFFAVYVRRASPLDISTAADDDVG
jgi:hypothetical protein